jgi:hypothetical protein
VSETYPKPRREAIAAAHLDILVEMMKGRPHWLQSWRVVRDPLPDDARVVRAGVDPQSGAGVDGAVVRDVRPGRGRLHAAAAAADDV